MITLIIVTAAAVIHDDLRPQLQLITSPLNDITGTVTPHQH